MDFDKKAGGLYTQKRSAGIDVSDVAIAEAWG